jgi:TolB-like protein/tetratricopeptide (TPR) repeat protein
LTDPAAEADREGPWARLRRRKVVQWGIAYVAGAWGSLQSLQYLGEIYGWSPHLGKVAILALLMGLPIVLVISWYHGDRGHQRVSRVELAILSVLVVLGVGIVWRYQSSKVLFAPTATMSETGPAAADAATTIKDPRPSIAVLPFENNSANHDDAYFVDGIQDDILTQLTKVGSLRVIARTSSELLRDTRLSIREIGARLGVSKLLEGRVQRAGNRVRINVLLIDTASESQVWAERYDRDVTAANILAIQSEVAATVAARLKVTFASTTDANRKGPASMPSLEAWEAFRRGQQASDRSEDLVTAEQHFRKAIDADPGFAPAYLALAETLIAQIYRSGARREVNFPEAESAVNTALQLDPTLADAWIASGNFAADRGDVQTAENMYRKAIEITPNSAQAYEKLSDLMWGDTGRMDDSTRYAEKGVALDPLSIGANQSLARNLVAAGRLDEAETIYRRMVEFNPTAPGAYASLASFEAYVRDRFADAVSLQEKAVELDPGNAYQYGSLAGMYMTLGQDVRAAEILNAALSRWPARTNLNIYAAALANIRGDQGAAIRYSQKVLETSPGNMFGIFILSQIDFARDDYAAARARFVACCPDLFAPEPPEIGPADFAEAIFLAAILLKTGEGERAKVLLDRAERHIRTIRRLGEHGYGIWDVRIHALRGDKVKALAALHAAVKEGWRGPVWRLQLGFDPALVSLGSDPEFKAAIADIERDMARQRAEVAARPKGAPLDLGVGQP